jgi:hypothetical protein
MGFVRPRSQRLPFGSTVDQSDQFSHTVPSRTSPTQMIKHAWRPGVFDCQIDTKLLENRKTEGRGAFSHHVRLRAPGRRQN